MSSSGVPSPMRATRNAGAVAVAMNSVLAPGHGLLRMRSSVRSIPAGAEIYALDRSEASAFGRGSRRRLGWTSAFDGLQHSGLVGA